MNPKIKEYASLLLRYLRLQRGQVFLLTVLLVIDIGLQLANPQVVRFFIDNIESANGLSKLLTAASIFIGIALIRQIVQVAGAYVGENVAWSATNALRSDLALHCLTLDLSFHKVHKPGELIERVDGDVNKLANFFSRLVIQLSTNLLLLVGVLVLLWQVNWQIGLSITVIALFGAYAVQWLNKRVVPRWEKVRQVETELFGSLEEWLNGTEDIRVNGATDYVLGQLHRLSRGRWLSVRHAMNLNVFVITLPITVFTLAYVAAHILGAGLFQNSLLTIGTLYLVFYYIDVIKSPLWEILRQVENLQEASASINRISSLFAEKPTIHDGVGADFGTGAMEVQFGQVNFHYADEPEHLVLKGIDFKLPAGRVLGLLGRTGSGKSTLTKLLFRFYDPIAGTICLNGIDIRQAQQNQLRQRIGMVTQEVELFYASVRDNLTLFDNQIPDEIVRQVIEEVGLNSWFATLPQGLDTLLEGNKGLSVGQAQLLAFARVFLRNPGLVILDEASSRLDPATEQLIERAIDRLLTGRTAIIVAHRLGTVQRADEIMILENGQIWEHGERLELASDPTSHFAHLLQVGMEQVMA